MNVRKLTKVLFTACNICMILISLIAILVPIISLTNINAKAKVIFNSVKKDYETCFGTKYIPEDSYFTDIACIKMEISSAIITRSATLKTQYFENIKGASSAEASAAKNETDNSDALDSLRSSLAELQAYNNAIEFKTASIPLDKSCKSLYTALNYMTYGSDALLKDVTNFIDDPEALSLAADKDTQEIRIMAQMSNSIYLNLNQQVLLYKFIAIAGIFILLGTILNIYRIRSRKSKYRRKRTIKKI
ncbi:hypothetical protein R2R35_05055 [Anaerocolumna sp. AGMB13020]|uniref:hypothetical protein n=1 Tax=Anaerocolumna sp. AGMB13020 TaxID=3081750 RepID=UPI00295456B1|nr:hypothetical protein [Anaerocolumna sp. AGMB13020]WOO37873.1 hypothetical protein R2R35_05055 [Anaerocolumna sp. AGMB13020]